jgi:pimeloyl-ACP methyl ester carboxylesterase
MRSSSLALAWLSLHAVAALQLAACSGDDETPIAEPSTDTSGGSPGTESDDESGDDAVRETAAPARPPAPAADSPCAGSPAGVSTIERPMFPDSESSPTFGYSYKLYPGSDPEAATVIYLPGGPGQPGIGVERDPEYAPLEYSLIETDLRGVGCNAPQDADHYPDEFYRSVYFADDVIAIIEDLALDNYVLYGISYGTALATTVASRIEERGLPPPRALVLEGVFGTAFTSDLPGTEIGFQERWRTVRDSLDENIRSQLVAEPLPFDLTPAQWGAGLQGALPIAETPMSQNLDYLGAVLTGLAPGVAEEQRNAVRDFILAVGASPVDAMGDRLHGVVTCHELAETDFASFSLEAGELAPNGLDCTDVALGHPFSAADWPVRAPIYYFSGTFDTNTPPWQARAHFDAQMAAPRQLVHIEGGGHNARILNLADCAGPLWQAMALGSALDAALATCQWPTELEAAPPAPAAE